MNLLRTQARAIGLEAKTLKGRAAKRLMNEARRLRKAAREAEGRA